MMAVFEGYGCQEPSTVKAMARRCVRPYTFSVRFITTDAIPGDAEIDGCTDHSLLFPLAS